MKRPLRILFIAPRHGGLQAYTDKLAAELASFGQQVVVAGIARENFPYDPIKHSWQAPSVAISAAREFIEGINLSEFDLIAFHFGRNDLEQVLPALLTDNRYLPPCVYFVHFLEWSLFSKRLGDCATQLAIHESLRSFFHSYIFYGEYPKRRFEKLLARRPSGIISYYPASHPESSLSTEEMKRFAIELGSFEASVPLVVLPGYASDYKDHQILLDSFEFVSSPLYFVFAGRGWHKRLGFYERSIGRVKVRVLERELSEEEFKHACELSSFGIFPYREPNPGEVTFQGSGALPNFLALGKPAVAFDTALMREYIGDAGWVCEETPLGLASSIDEALSPLRLARSERAFERREAFSMKRHARDCASHFIDVLDYGQSFTSAFR